jgi:hypothetical protein
VLDFLFALKGRFLHPQVPDPAADGAGSSGFREWEFLKLIRAFVLR